MTVAVCFATGATVKNFRGRVAAIFAALGFAVLVEKSGETWWTNEGPSQATTKPRRKVTKKRMEESIRTKQSGNPGDCQFPPPIDIRPVRGADRTWNRCKSFRLSPFSGTSTHPSLSLSLSPSPAPLQPIYSKKKLSLSLMYQAYASFHGQTMSSRLVFHALHITSLVQA